MKSPFGKLYHTCYNPAMNAYQITGLIGIVLTIVVVFLVQKKTKLTKSHLVYLCICGIAGVFVGGHLMFFIVGLPDFIKNDVPNIHTLDQFLDAFYYAASGMVFYGGLLCALLFMFIYIKARKLPARPYLNNTVVAFPLFHFMGRIGCSLTGCCYGIEYHGPFALHYTPSHITPGLNDDIADFARFPVQPMEALIELLIFVLLLVLLLKKGDSFSVTSTYLLIYSVVRFLDEFLRGDALRGFWGPLSTSQWISLAIFIGTVIYLIVSRSKNRPALSSA